MPLLLTDHDCHLASLGAPERISRIRALSPGWASGCRGCTTQERRCSNVQAACPDDADAMRAAAHKGGE